MCGDKVILVVVILAIGQSFLTNAAPLEKTWSIVQINPPKVGDIRLKVIKNLCNKKKKKKSLLFFFCALFLCCMIYLFFMENFMYALFSL